MVGSKGQGARGGHSHGIVLKDSLLYLPCSLYRSRSLACKFVLCNLIEYDDRR